MQEDKIIEKLLEHDGRFVDLNNKIENGFEQNTEILEKISTTVQHLDQERIFTAGWVRRIEDEVEHHSKDIKEMKLKLNIS
jgi:hypothetical protein